MPYLNDSTGDLLTRIRNAQHARRPSCRAMWSRLNEDLCRLLVREGWLKGVRIVGEAPKQDIEITFHPDKPALALKRISKPGRRVYAGNAELKPVMRGFGLAVLTTSRGLLTDREARAQKVGGEVLCTIS